MVVVSRGLIIPMVKRTNVFLSASARKTLAICIPPSSHNRDKTLRCFRDNTRTTRFLRDYVFALY